MFEPSTALLAFLTPVAPKPVHRPHMAPIGSFRAACHKSYRQDDANGNGQVVDCDETFEGAQDIARYTEHMKTVHGLRLPSQPAWITSKPYSFKAPKPGSLPPAGKRRDDFLAAMEPAIEEAA